MVVGFFLFSCIFFPVVSYKHFPETKDGFTLQRGSKRYLETTSNSLLFSEKNISLVTEKSLKNNATSTTYLMFGVGTVMAILLFIIVIELWKKFQSKRKKLSTEQKRNNSIVRMEESSQQLNHFYHVDTIYYEIDDPIERIQQTDFSNTVNDFKYQDIT